MNYPKVQLGEVCDLIYGDGLKEQARQGGAVPVYGSNGVVGYHNKALTTGETIVIGRKGSIGEVHICRVPCWPIDTTYYIENTKIPCDFTWLYYILIALDLTRFNKSAAVPGLNRDDAYEQFIPLPPLDEQRRIAAILQRADRIRRLRRLSRQLSDTFLQSVFLQMFGDPATNPRKLPVVEIQDVTQSLDSKRIPVEASIRRIRKGEYPYYGASGIIDYIDNYLFEEETLLVAEDGANLLTRSTPIAFIVSGKDEKKLLDHYQP
ncbi:MAG TPA: restriction endonuclease subunit S, partial [Anaerolineaceae bacterium]|nr:restriction endonuclease subunit S [Anaerolineaceae bacterium]